jgi:origin recognition complex subunit 1
MYAHQTRHQHHCNRLDYADISGVPGTGKTATVREVLRSLNTQTSSSNGDLSNFDVLEINGMTVADPNYTYSLLWERFSGRKLPSAQAQQCLDEYFNLESSGAKHRRQSTAMKQRRMCVLVMDELDQLVTKKQTLIYNMFNWPTRPDSNLIVVAIANTMDLPERVLSNKVASRLGNNGRIMRNLCIITSL